MKSATLMDVREQIESDLRSFSNSKVPPSVKKAMDQTIFKLRTHTSAVEIHDANDPYVTVFDAICHDKKLQPESIVMLSTIRALTESGVIDGDALTKVFDAITSVLPQSSEQFKLKVLQIAISSFISPSKKPEPRDTSTKWVLSLASSASSTIKDVSVATIYQLIDCAFDSLSAKSPPIQQQTPDLAEAAESLLSADTASDVESSPISPPSLDLSHWALLYLFSLIDDLLSVLLSEKISKFNDLSLMQPSVPSILSHIFDRSFPLLSASPQYQQMVTRLTKLSNIQTDPISFARFAPYLVLSDPSLAHQISVKLASLIEENPTLLITFASIVASKPDLQFASIDQATLTKVATSASNYFLSNFKGVITEPITLHPSFSISSPTVNQILHSSVLILYFQISLCVRHPSHFPSIFDLFDTVWQRVVQTTEDSDTLKTSLKIARVSVKVALALKQTDPINRIFSSLCGLALPSSSAYPLGAKSVIALHSILRLLKQLTTRLISQWPLILETISKCFHAASHLRSPADSLASKMISEDPLSFCTSIDSDSFSVLFSTILQLSKNESHSFLERKGSVPNYWPIDTLVSIYGANLQRIEIQSSFFDHLRSQIGGETAEFRAHSAQKAFEISSTIVNFPSSSAESRSSAFDILLLSANSAHREVSTLAFSSLPSFLAGGTAEKVGDGWPMILTITKLVWASQFQENIQNGFRTLTFVCTDCLRLLNLGDLEMCLSAISSYISQESDVNVSLGSIGLLWNVGSGLIPVKGDEEISLWKVLLRILQMNFASLRQNIRASSLQTFFSLVNTYHGQFPQQLQKHVYESVFIPLLEGIVPGQMIDCSILALQGVIQCLQSFGNYQKVVPLVIQTIVKLAVSPEISSKGGDIVRCFVPLIFIEDNGMLSDLTKAYSSVIGIYAGKPKDSDIQGSAIVLTEVFPKIVNRMDDKIFDEWIEIIHTLCSFQVDKPFLHVSTHAALNVLVAIPVIPEERLIKIMRMLLRLISIRHKPLTSKVLETIGEIYGKLFNDKGRADCLEVLLPMFRENLSSDEFMECFKGCLECKMDDNLIATKESAVQGLVEIARRRAEFMGTIAWKLGQKMDLMADSTFDVFLSLGRVDTNVFFWFFSLFCKGGDWAAKVKGKIFSEIAKEANLISAEEEATGAILQKSRYSGMVSLLNSVVELKTDERIFGIDRCGSVGHLCELSGITLPLAGCRCKELRDVCQRISVLSSSQLMLKNKVV